MGLVSFRRTLAALALACLGGCYGQFAVTREVLKRNANVESAPAREGIFLALLIVPVYEVSVLADLLVFNAVELATGENPARDHETPGERGDVESE
jgi:hypothetical protein